MKLPDSWVINRGFVIRHKPSGKYIPNIKPGNRRGGSMVEPEDPEKQAPRFFTSKISAECYLSQWCRGKHVCHRDYDGDETIEIIPQPHRNKADMEIVPIAVVLQETEK